MTETKHDRKLERDALVSQWQASGLKKVDFCRKHPIKVKQFYNWVTSSSEKKVKNKPIGFNVVRARDVNVSSELILVQPQFGVFSVQSGSPSALMAAIFSGSMV